MRSFSSSGIRIFLIMAAALSFSAVSGVYAQPTRAKETDSVYVAPEVKTCIEGLYSANPQERMSAMAKLGALGEQAAPALKYLVEMVNSCAVAEGFSDTEGEYAAITIWKIKSPASFIASFNSSEPRERKFALMLADKTLKAKPSKGIDFDIWPLMALGPAGKENYKKFLEAVYARLNDEDPEIRYLAVNILKRVDNEPALKLLIPLLKDFNPRVRKAAINAAGFIGIERRIGFVTQVCDGKEQRIAIARLLLPLLKDTDPEIQAAVIDALKYSRDKEAAAAVVSFLKDSDPLLRAAAARSLRGFYDENLKSVIPLLRDENPLVRQTAADTLIYAAYHYTIEYCQQSLCDSEYDKHYKAPKDTTLYLIETMTGLLSDDSPFIRKTAFSVLAGILGMCSDMPCLYRGFKARSIRSNALGAIKRALKKEKDPEVRKVAESSWQIIQKGR